MGSEVDTELVVGRDLAAGLIRPGQLRRTQRPVDAAMLPPGAAEALDRAIGHCELDDLLLVPAHVRPAGPLWHRYRRYAPLCVLGLGEDGAGLWTEGPRAGEPGVRAVLPYPAIAAIARQAGRHWRRLCVTSADSGFTVYYDADGDASVDIWTGRLRRRCGQREEIRRRRGPG